MVVEEEEAVGTNIQVAHLSSSHASYFHMNPTSQDNARGMNNKAVPVVCLYSCEIREVQQQQYQCEVILGGLEMCYSKIKMVTTDFLPPAYAGR